MMVGGAGLTGRPVMPQVVEVEVLEASTTGSPAEDVAAEDVADVNARK